MVERDCERLQTELENEQGSEQAATIRGSAENPSVSCAILSAKGPIIMLTFLCVCTAWSACRANLKMLEAKYRRCRAKFKYARPVLEMLYQILPDLLAAFDKVGSDFKAVRDART